MFGGSVVAWLALIPLLKLFGAGMANPLYPSTIPVGQMDANAIWSSYIRYVGAGAVAAGGFISLVRSLPTLVSSFRQAAAGMRKGEAGKVTRMNQEAPLTWVIGAAVLGFLLVWFVRWWAAAWWARHGRAVQLLLRGGFGPDGRA